jgi:hypothetical protein
MNDGLLRRDRQFFSGGVGGDRASTGTTRTVRRARSPGGLGGRGTARPRHRGRDTSRGAPRWWGWPVPPGSACWSIVVASVVVLENLVLIAILFRSRSVVRRAMAESPDRPLTIGRPRDDVFGRWWRTALLIPFHPRAMQLQRNISYGPLERQRLDVWRFSTTPSKAPVIYYVHGGAWTFGDKREQGRPMLHEFVRRGWIVVAINYRLAPGFPWPAQIEDVTRALGWIKKNIATYGGDPDRVVVAGGSAGGHLAALLALTSHDPDLATRGDVGRSRLVGARGALVLRGARDDRGRRAVARNGSGPSPTPGHPHRATALRGQRSTSTGPSLPTSASRPTRRRSSSCKERTTRWWR